jgi:RND family efflux transporter MFP subunit
VVVAAPISREVTEYDEFTGRTEAVDSVEIRAQISGYVSSISFTDGAIVKQGDVLFQIDDRPYQAALARAEAEVVRVTAMLDKNRNELARAEEPYKTGAVSAVEYDNLTQAVKGGEGQLAAAKAEVESARLNVNYCRITAPISGRVSRQLVSVGNLVSNQTVLTSIVSTNPMYVYFDVDERSILYYQSLAQKEEQRPEHIRNRKTPVWMARATDKGFPFEGLIDFVDNRINQGTGTVQVRAVFDNSSGVLVPGLFVRVRMQRSLPVEALLVPERALGNDQGNRFLFVVGADNTVQHRPVEVGSLTGDEMRVIRSGLSAGELVIIDGVQRARSGAKVTPQRKELAPATQPGAAE